MTTDTPAAELRAAAEKLRDLAAAVGDPDRPGRPWHTDQCGDKSRGECPCIVAQGHTSTTSGVSTSLNYIADTEHPDLAAYIAAMDPSVGLALADWLDSAAEDAEQIGADHHALAVARRILGTTEQTQPATGIRGLLEHVGIDTTGGDITVAGDVVDQAPLRDRIRRAVCEAEGFAWDADMLEPDEYGEVADAVLAVLPDSTTKQTCPECGTSGACNGGPCPLGTTEQADTMAAPVPLSEVWTVWHQDESVYAHYATEEAAKYGTIDCWQEDEPSCPDYSWRQDGPRLELVVGGEHGGVYASRHRVYGAPETEAPTVDRATVLREAADWFEADGRYVQQFYGHQIGTELRRLAAEAQQPTPAPAEETKPEVPPLAVGDRYECRTRARTVTVTRLWVDEYGADAVAFEWRGGMSGAAHSAEMFHQLYRPAP